MFRELTLKVDLSNILVKSVNKIPANYLYFVFNYSIIL